MYMTKTKPVTYVQAVNSSLLLHLHGILLTIAQQHTVYYLHPFDHDQVKGCMGTLVNTPLIWKPHTFLCFSYSSPTSNHPPVGSLGGCYYHQSPSHGKREVSMWGVTRPEPRHCTTFRPCLWTATSTLAMWPV